MYLDDMEMYTMLARLIQNAHGEYQFLYSDGTVSTANNNTVHKFLYEHKKAAKFTGKDGTWKSVAVHDMAIYEGKTFAYITDEGYLVIMDFTPFSQLLATPAEINYISTKEFGERHNRSADMVKVLCRDGRIPGAKKMGRSWRIPEDAEYPVAPEDQREYVSEMLSKSKKHNSK